MKLKNVFYINLDSRKDRRKFVENELNQLGWEYERFDAIKNNVGAIGCSFSHLKVIMNAKEQNLDYVVVLEDDAEFLKKDFINNEIEKVFNTDISYDVLLLAGNIRPPVIKNTEYEHLSLHQIKKSWCGTAYIVPNHYYDTLINNIRDGLRHFLKNPDKGYLYAWDCWWMKLQEKDKWLIILPRTVVQRADYSNIEERNVDYRHLMSDIGKT